MERRDFLSAMFATCAAPVIGQIAPSAASARAMKWSKGDYLYCDAQLVAKLWNQPVSAAKSDISQKVLNGASAPLNMALQSARREFAAEADSLCQYYDHGYDYKDMKALGELWSVETWDAKTKSNQLLFKGEYGTLKKQVKAAHQKIARRPQPEVSHADRAYWSKGDYLYCDARLVAEHWRAPVSAAQRAIEDKLLKGRKQDVESLLRQARSAIPTNKARTICSYHENGYSYEDMEALGELWKTDSWEAKGRVSRKLFSGQRAEVERAVTSARAQAAAAQETKRKRLRTPEMKRARRQAAINLQHFNKSGYTYCDAAVIADLWGMTPVRAKLKMGRLLRQGEDADLKNTMTVARRQAEPQADDLCSYSMGGYSYSDLTAIAKAWRVDEFEAKHRISLKLVRGEQEYIDRTLKAARRPR